MGRGSGIGTGREGEHRLCTCEILLGDRDLGKERTADADPEQRANLLRTRKRLLKMLPRRWKREQIKGEETQENVCIRRPGSMFDFHRDVQAGLRAPPRPRVLTLGAQTACQRDQNVRFSSAPTHLTSMDECLFVLADALCPGRLPCGKSIEIIRSAQSHHSETEDEPLANFECAPERNGLCVISDAYPDLTTAITGEQAHPASRRRSGREHLLDLRRDRIAICAQNRRRRRSTSAASMRRVARK